MASKKTASPAKASAKGKATSTPAKAAPAGKPVVAPPAKIAHTPHRFDGKVVVTTGAAAGLGRATVLRLALEGAAIEGGQSCKY